MRCYCCNKILMPSEATAKFRESGTYTDMCNQCLSEISEVETIEGAGEDDQLFDDDGNPVED